MVFKTTLHCKSRFDFTQLFLYAFLCFVYANSLSNSLAAESNATQEAIGRFDVDFKSHELWYTLSDISGHSDQNQSFWINLENTEEALKSTVEHMWMSSLGWYVCFKPPDRDHDDRTYYITQVGQELCIEGGKLSPNASHTAIAMNRPSVNTRLALAGQSDWLAINVLNYSGKEWLLAIYNWDDLERCIKKGEGRYSSARANTCNTTCVDEECPLGRHYIIRSGDAKYLVREHFEADIGLHPDTKALRVVFQSGIDKKKNITVSEKLLLIEILANELPATIDNFEIKRDLSNRRSVEIGDSDGQFSKGWKGHPRFSPDGNWIAYLATTSEHDESAETELLVIPADLAMEKMTDARSSNISNRINRPVTSFQWSCNSQCILFQVSSEADRPLYQANLENGNWLIPSQHRPVVSGVSTITQFKAGEDGLELFVLRSSLNETPSILRLQRKLNTQSFFCDLENENPQCSIIAKSNFEVSNPVELQRGSVQSINPSGEPVDYFLLRSGGCTESTPCPLVVRIHGGPNGVWDSSFDPITYALTQAGYVVLLPNPTGSIGFGQAFTDAVKKQWGGAVVDDVISVMNNVTDLPFVDKNRIYGMGSSYGGYLMNYFLVDGQSEAGIQPNFNFNALVSINGVWDLKEFACETDQPWFPYDQLGIAAGDPACAPNAPSKRLDFNPVDRKKNLLSIPTLVIYSIGDNRVPPEKQNIALGKFLEDQPNAELFRTRELPGGHRLLNSEWKTVLKESLEHFKAHR